MNTKTIGLFLIPVFAGILIAWAPTTAYAGGDPPYGMRADVEKGFVCGVPGADANGNLIFGGGLTTDSISVISNSRTGSVTLVCTLAEGTNLSGHTAIFEGFLCGLGVKITTDSKVTIAPNGNTVLICKLNSPLGGA